MPLRDAARGPPNVDQVPAELGADGIVGGSQSRGAVGTPAVTSGFVARGEGAAGLVGFQPEAKRFRSSASSGVCGLGTWLFEELGPGL